MSIKDLNESFSISGCVNIVGGKGDLPVIEVSNSSATAKISLYGGQVLSYVPAAKHELLFLSELAYYEKGKAIKGGIPVCWPWFGQDPEAKGRPAHGFARYKMWQLNAAEKISDEKTKVTLTLSDDAETKNLWPYEFNLSLEVVVGETLEVKLISKNISGKPFVVTQALHTYFSVKDVSKVEIVGLDGAAYLDKAKSNTGEENRLQEGNVSFNQEVDRIYLKAPNKLSIFENEQTSTEAFSVGNKTCVVWNPWKELCEASADLKPDDYKRFVCVETTNAGDDVVTIKPGEEYQISASYKSVVLS